MSLPLATTRITVRRSDQDGTKDSADTLTWADIATGIPAVISSPGGAETVADGTSAVVGARLNCDPTDLRHTDRVVDETTGLVYEVSWAATRTGFGVDHVVADLLVVTDRAAV